jgi:hypothetical protein
MIQMMGGLTTHSTGARVSLSFIENLSVMALCSRPVNSVVRHASRNKRIRSCREKLKKGNAGLNDEITGRSNNSFNRSASELACHRELVCIGGSSRSVNSGVRHASRNKRIESYVMRLRKADAELNGTITGRSNNSLNRSASQLAFDRELGRRGVVCAPG